MRLYGALLSVLLASAAFAADPPAPKPQPSLDELLAKLDAASKVKTDADKAIAALKKDLLKQYADLTARLKKAGVLDPTPPKPPGPKPPPVPPVPPPKPVDPAPIPGDGLRVLIVFESADLARYPPTQNAILTALPIRDYLNAKCPKVGTTAEFRIWDKDVDGYSDSKLWGDALKRPRDSTPWIVISNGTAGFEGPLPANVADTLTLLKKYGG